jgi:hypothetical protein
MVIAGDRVLRWVAAYHGRRLLVMLMAVLAAFGTVMPLQAAEEDESLISTDIQEIYFPSGRASAMGGPHAAQANDFSVLFCNPAGFQAVEPQFSVAELTAWLKGPIFDMAGLIIQTAQGSELTDLLGSPVVQDMVRSLYAGAEVVGPLNFGYVGNGIGLGLMNLTSLTLSSGGPLTVTMALSEQVLLCGGYAFRIPLPAKSLSALDIGFLLKGSLIGRLSFKKSLLELADMFTSFSAETLTSEPFDFIAAIGIDLGIRYQLGEWLAIGITGEDVFTPILTSHYVTVDEFTENTQEPTRTKAILPFKLNGGIMLSPPLGPVERVINEISLYVDYNDIFDFLITPSTSTHPILHLSVGLEMRFLRILSVRVGLNQGLFAAGLGLDLQYFILNASMFGTELSSEPGLRPVYNLMVGFEFRI